MYFIESRSTQDIISILSLKRSLSSIKPLLIYIDEEIEVEKSPVLSYLRAKWRLGFQHKTNYYYSR